jgi:hypothetical protein
MKMISNKEPTPVNLVAGQMDTDPVVGAVLRTPGTLVLEHRFDLLVLLRQLHRRNDIDVALLRRSGRVKQPAPVEQILADVFTLPGVTDANDGQGRTFLSRVPLAQRVS